jgi:thiol-disulfide isomerase/thioredoxin
MLDLKSMPSRIVLASVLCVAALAGSVHAAGVGTAKPWIGILIEEGTKGVRVKQVVDATPGARAGLATGDEVLFLDGVAVSAPAELIEKVQSKGVGQKVTLRVLRGGKEQDITLALESRPDELELLRSRLVAKPAPAFAPAAIGAQPAGLAELAGKVVVLEFWATWCGPCNLSIPHLNGWQEKYGPKGLRVVAISAEDRETLAPFVKERKIKYAVGSDPDAKVSSAYFVPAIPTIVVIDATGIVRYAGVGIGATLDQAEVVFKKLLEPGKQR